MLQNAALNVIQADWFKVSSHKLSSPAQVEDYLSSFNQISPHLLEHIVNMSDANVSIVLKMFNSQVICTLKTELCS